MTWTQRLQTVKNEAARTGGFGYSNYIQKLYFKLLTAVNKRDAEITKQLIIKMGF